MGRNDRQGRTRFVSPSDGEERRRSAQPSSGINQRHPIGRFELFCSYHLGITAEGTYRFQNVHQVAKRFNTNAAVVKQLLVDYDLDPETIINTNFDMAGAQVDVMLAPEGIDRMAIAQEFYKEFQEAPKKSRNWKKELEQDARDNDRTFSRR